MVPVVSVLVAAALTALAYAAETGPVAFVGVNVLPMTGETVLEGQTVVVKEGRIAAAGPSATVEPPAGALIVDGRGKFLMPGLCDMHTHLISEDELKLYLATGVTTIRNMGGQPWHLELRARLNSGQTLGPRFTTAGPILQTLPCGRSLPPPFLNVCTPGEAKASVRETARLGYDAVKIHRYITNETFGAIIETAHEIGLPVVGHVADAVDTADAIRAGMRSIEHTTGYEKQVAEIDRLVALTVERGAWNCFTLSPVWTNENIDAIKAAEPAEVAYVAPIQLARWRKGPPKIREYPKYERILMTLHRRGAKLMLGTDTSTPYNIAGFAVHQELRLAVAAGLTPYEALRYATVTPASFLGESDEAGTVEVGKRADLVLLEANPFEDISATRRIAGVMVRGIYLDPQELDRMLEEVAAAVRRPAADEAPSSP